MLAIKILDRIVTRGRSPEHWRNGKSYEKFRVTMFLGLKENEWHIIIFDILWPELVELDEEVFLQRSMTTCAVMARLLKNPF